MLPLHLNTSGVKKAHLYFWDALSISFNLETRAVNCYAIVAKILPIFIYFLNTNFKGKDLDFQLECKNEEAEWIF